MGVLFEDPKQYNLPVTIRSQVKGLTNELYAEPKITFHFEFFFFYFTHQRYGVQVTPHIIYSMPDR